MHPKPFIRAFIAIVMSLAAFAAMAQTPPPKPLAYGPAVGVEMARKIVAAAVAEAAKNGWAMSIAITNTAGDLVYFEKMDDCQTGSIQVAIGKSRSAAMFKRPTKAFNEALAAGNTYILALANANPIEGGFPLVADGKIIGAIGVSGGTGAQDSATATAGLAGMR